MQGLPGNGTGSCGLGLVAGTARHPPGPPQTAEWALSSWGGGSSGGLQLLPPFNQESGVWQTPSVTDDPASTVTGQSSAREVDQCAWLHLWPGLLHLPSDGGTTRPTTVSMWHRALATSQRTRSVLGRQGLTWVGAKGVLSGDCEQNTSRAGSALTETFAARAFYSLIGLRSYF